MSVFKYPLLPLKRVATINDEVLGENADPDYELQYIDIGNVDSNGEIHEIATYRFENAPSRARRIVKDGDIIISTVRTYLQAITQIKDPPDNLIVSTGFAVVRPRPHVLDTGYCKYALREPLFLHEVVGRSVGVSYPAITSLDLADIPIFVPSLLQQRAIAAYLDRETARLDTLIAAKTRLLELLAEKRRAVITHTVTCGLNPDIPMRDSGVEWLGKIPSFWKVVPLKFLGRVRTGVAKGRNLGNAQTVWVPYLRVANVQDGYLDLSDVAKIEVLPEEIASFQLEKGDVLMNEGGDADKLGRGTVWDAAIDPCLHQNHVFAVRCFGIEPKWLTTVTSTNYAKAYFESRSKQSTNLASISATNLQELPVVVPPPLERDAIVYYVEEVTGKIDQLATATKHTLELLRERRSALIAAAVSGQIEVTG